MIAIVWFHLRTILQTVQYIKFVKRETTLD